MKKISFIFLFLYILNLGCSARVITLEASDSLDPAPITKVSVNKGADKFLSKQWNLEKIGFNKGIAPVAIGSQRVTIAILGSGIDYNHEDLIGRVKVNTKEWKDVVTGSNTQSNNVDDDENGYVDDFVGYDFVEDDGLAFDRNGSGTAMAGVIAAGSENSVGIKGIMQEVSLVPVRFIDQSGQFLFPNLIKALNYALKEKVDVIALHMPRYDFKQALFEQGDFERESLKNILESIQKKGIPVVVSAGNFAAQSYSLNSLLGLFLKYSNVVSVTSSDVNDKKPYIANVGMSHVYTAAPGDDVFTTLPGNDYGSVSGTSVAAAHVAAAVGSAIALRYGQISTDKILKSLLKPDASDAADDFKLQTVGGNRLNIKKYLDYIKSL